MMDRCKAPSYMGGVSELNKFDLQRFATVDNPYETIIDSNIVTGGYIDRQRTNVSLRYYARDYIDNRETIITLSQENIEYLSSGLSATDCYSMFSGCQALTSIPWNEFDIDTSQCTNMSYMFSNCNALANLDLSNFNTSKVTDMGSMFGYCRTLANLDLSNFNTSQCTDISYMFQYCNTLISLDLSNFDTSKVINMTRLFQYCSSLQEIICTNGFDLSSCGNVEYMFLSINNNYNGEPLHFKNVPQNLDFSNIRGTEGMHYIIDSYKD